MRHPNKPKKVTFGDSQLRQLEDTIAEIYELAKTIENPAMIVFVLKIPDTKRLHYKMCTDGTIKTNNYHG